jgi:hypothetical protein
MRYCKSCGEQIHPKRIEIIPNATSCVPCSTTEKRGAVTVMKGEGDHTWVETVFMEREDYNKYMEQEGKIKKIVASATKAEYQDYDNVVEPSTPIVITED